MSDFELAVDFVLSNEGGCVENLDGDGSPTNSGIKLDTLLAAYPNEKFDFDDVRNLTLEKKKEVLKIVYWDKSTLGQIPYQNIATTIFDAAVHCGLSEAVKFSQRAIWATYGKYDFIKDDGIMGEKTLNAIRASGFNFLPAFRSERASFYKLVCKTHPEKEKFLAGWLERAYKNVR